MGENEHISRERAKELIDEHQSGTLIVADLDPVPAIGAVDEREYNASIESYNFGEFELLGEGEDAARR